MAGAKKKKQTATTGDLRRWQQMSMPQLIRENRSFAHKRLSIHEYNARALPSPSSLSSNRDKRVHCEQGSCFTHANCQRCHYTLRSHDRKYTSRSYASSGSMRAAVNLEGTNLGDRRREHGKDCGAGVAGESLRRASSC